MIENQGVMGTLPDLGVEDYDMSDVDDYIMAQASYAGKIQQTDVSIPMSMAAIGEESYIDIDNVSQMSGFVSGTPEVNGVILNENGDGGVAGFADEYDGPTGFASYAQNKARLTPKIVAEARRQGVNPNLVMALIQQESGFNPQARSKAGAMGLGQLMPATARAMGVTDPYNEDQNIMGTVKYLSQQINAFDNEDLALAAYNAGPGAVSKANGIPNIPETRNYVKSIKSIMGGTVSNEGYALKYSFADNKHKLVDRNTGLLRVQGVNDFVANILNDPSVKDKYLYVGTNRPELLENKPQYAAFAKYRAKKAPDGGPLFRKQVGKYNGLVLHVKSDRGRAFANGQLNPNAISGLAKSTHNTQTTHLAPNSEEAIEAILTAMKGRGTQVVENGRFGLANLTAQEYNDYGVPNEALGNPVLQARVLNQEFQRAIDALGSEQKALYAMAGGNLKEAGQKESKTWAEIKQDQYNYTKDWFIAPPEDARERNNINECIAIYNAKLKQLRGD